MLYGSSNTPSQKNRNVEALRGIACILLVAYHVIGDNPLVGLQIPNDSILREIVNLFAYVRMPLFTVLSGYVYAARPFKSGVKSFLTGKARRLLLPMLVVGTLFAITRNLVSGTNTQFSSQDWLTIHIIPVDHFWFVEALFIIFAMMMIIELLKLMSNAISYTIILSVACTLHIMHPTLPEYFAIDKVLYLLPYFLIGVGVCRYRATIFSSHYLLVMLVIFTTLFTLSALGIIEKSVGGHQQTWIALVIGSLAVTLLIATNLQPKWLVKIGMHSYSIYLFHAFFTAGSRIILQKLGVNDISLLLISGLLFGIILPLLLEISTEKFAVVSTLFYGKRWKPKARHSTQRSAITP